MNPMLLLLARSRLGGAQTAQLERDEIMRQRAIKAALEGLRRLGPVEPLPQAPSELGPPTPQGFESMYLRKWGLA